VGQRLAIGGWRLALLVAVEMQVVLVVFV